MKPENALKRLQKRLRKDLKDCMELYRAYKDMIEGMSPRVVGRSHRAFLICIGTRNDMETGNARTVTARAGSIGQ
jgi:hypothetical protein